MAARAQMEALRYSSIPPRRFVDPARLDLRRRPPALRVPRAPDRLRVLAARFVPARFRPRDAARPRDDCDPLEPRLDFRAMVQFLPRSFTHQSASHVPPDADDGSESCWGRRHPTIRHCSEIACACNM